MLYKNLDKVYASLPLQIRSPLKRFLMARLKPRLKKFYSQFVKPGALVYDVGANEGDYTEVFLELGGNVLCIEPQPEYIKKLKKKFGHEKRIKIITQGVGERCEKLDFHISTFNSPNSSFSVDFREHSRYNYRDWDKTIKVQITTLNTLIKERGQPDFCKIDVEGYEWEVLSTLKKPVPALSFEFLTEMNNKSFSTIKFLDTLGKGKYNFCLGMKYHYELQDWISGKEMITLLNLNQPRQWCGDIYAKFERF